MPMLNSKLMEKAVQTATREILRKLRGAKLGKRATAKAMEALGKSRNGKPLAKNPFKMGPKNRAMMLRLLKENGPFVVLGRGGKVRLLTLEGYKAMAKAASESATKHQPWKARWEKKTEKPAKKVFKFKLKKHRKLHWTQKPENRAKVEARI